LDSNISIPYGGLDYIGPVETIGQPSVWNNTFSSLARYAGKRISVVSGGLTNWVFAPVNALVGSPSSIGVVCNSHSYTKPIPNSKMLLPQSQQIQLILILVQMV
jgi:hypothetical protein